MNAAAPWARVLLAPWQQRRNQGPMWPLLLLLGLVVVPALAATVLAPTRPLTALAVAVLAMPLFGAWIWLLLSLMQQNHPNAARLVPGHLRTLRGVMGGAWLVLTVFSALVGAAVGHAGGMAAGAALLLTLLAWTVRWPLLGAVFWLALVSNPLWLEAPALAGLRRSVAQAWQQPPDAIALAAWPVLLGAALVSVLAVLRAGGARHALAHQQRAKQIAAVRVGGARPGSWSASGGTIARRLGHGATAVYWRWLARASAQRRGAVLPRALLGLGPTIHWTGQLGQVLTFGAVAALVLLVVWQANAVTESVSVAAWGLSIGILTFAVNVALQARAAIHGTRREQALMMLLPGMPRGRALNRALAWRLSVQFLCSWALGVAACVAVLPLGAQFGRFAIYAAACLPLGALLWTDWSRVRPPTAMSAVAPLLVVMPLALCAIAANAWIGVPAWAGVLCFVVAAVLLTIRRVRRVADAPAAFPAGRLV